MFDSSFTALKGVLSRSFVVGAFLPVLAVIAINLLFVALATKGLAESISYLKDTLSVADVATAIGVLTFVTLPSAFVLSSLLTPFRRLLEGDWLPAPLREDMLAAARKRAGMASTDAAAGNDYIRSFVGCESAASGLSAIIQERRKEPKVIDPALIAPALAAVTAFDDAAARFRGCPPKQFATRSKAVIISFGRAVADLGTALKANAIDDFAPATSAADLQEAERLGAAYDLFLVLVTTAHEDARLEAGRRSATMDRLLVAKDPRPTRLGNIRAQFEDYTMAAYGVGFDYLWPRLRMGIDNDEDKFEPVEQAETQLNFMLMLLLLAALSFFGWFLYLAVWTRSVGSLVITAVAAPAVLYLFYSAVVESQRAELAVTKAAIDRLRLGLLTALRAPEPGNYGEELKCWAALSSLSAGHLRGQAFDYAAPK